MIRLRILPAVGRDRDHRPEGSRCHRCLQPDRTTKNSRSKRADQDVNDMLFRCEAARSMKEKRHPQRAPLFLQTRCKRRGGIWWAL